MAKEISFNIEARKKMEAGVNKLADTVTLLTTETAVADIREKKSPVPAAGGADMDY